MLMAGCLGALSGDGTDPAEYVPSDTDTLIHIDMAMLADDDHQQLVDSMADGESDDTNDQEDIVSEFEAETGLELEDADELLLFTSFDDNPWDDSGIIVQSDWTTDEVVSAAEDTEETPYEEREFDGETVHYEPESESRQSTEMHIGELGDGTFVFGSQDTVEASLAVEYGDEEALSGDIRDAYDETRDGHVTLATTLPKSTVPTDDPSAPDDIDFEAFYNVEVLTSVYDTDDGEAGFETTLHTTGEDEALDVADVIDGGISIASGSMADDDLQSELRKIDVEQDGDTVEVTYWGEIDDVTQLIENGLP
ncbi:hypothetical protein C482_04391 [Natrialba chahannaoensis JCM 10990]|uniref:Uncharacterized protein n=2 Tax=Natrialba chahannaoensis TaxID=68911 RepID=M0AW10_9EURY|nr:hypothetical protein C482_04391 [Natrialba chahannaoensis JCM 10990]